jgi:predicted GNAT family acetyltransferase
MQNGCMASSANPAVSVRHNPAQSRFEAQVEGQLCVADYRMRKGVIVLTHTGVPQALRGRGIARQLMHAAFDYARANHLRVDPQCSYAEVYVQRHPEVRDLVVS